LNKIYRLIWSRRHGCLVAVAENARSHSGGSSRRSYVVGALCIGSIALTISFSTLAADCSFSAGDTISTTCELPISPGLTVSGSQKIEVTSGTGVAAQTTIAFDSGSLRNSGIISGTTDGIRNTVGTLRGFISNSGTIQGGENALNLTNVTHYISNTGTITGSGIGIRLTNGTLAGGISNTGLISGVTEAIRIDNATFSNFSTNIPLLNSGTITASGGDAFRSGNSSTGTTTNIYGTISNSGIIAGTRAIVLDGGTNHVGSIRNTNTGSIIGVNTGIHIGSTLFSSALSGSIQNQGLIQGGNTGIYIQNGTLTSVRNYAGTISGSLANSIAIWIAKGRISDGISNSGTIGGTTSGGTAIKIGDGANIGTVTGAYYIPGITNSGTIGLGNIGIDIDSGSSLTHSLVNSGTISANTTALRILGTLANNSISGNAIVNSGTISALSGSAIQVGSGTLAGTISGSIYNSNTGTITGTTAIRIDQNGTLSGRLTNDGTIAGNSSNYGISNSGSITGGIRNTGLIYGGPSGRSGTAISINGTDSSARAIVSSGLTNLGVISGETGIFLNQYGTITGGITNSGSIFARTFGAGGDSAIAILGYVSGSGGRASILNTGTIDGGTNGSGIAIGSSYAGTLSGSIQNSGRIDGGQAGINLLNGTITGGITNSVSGVISSSQVNSSAIWIAGSNATSSGGLSGGIRNEGTIGGTVGGAKGIAVGDGMLASTLSGGVTNSGTIGRSSYGLDIQTLSSLTGGLINSGTIAGTSVGVNVYGVLANNGSGNAIVNSGTISALSGSAIQVGSGTLAGTISGSINNSGQIIGALSGIQVANNGVIIGQISNSGTITGTNAFNLANTASPFVINNTGVINGNVILGNNTLNLNGLSNIVNGSISGGTSSAVNLSGSLASSGDIDVGSFNIQSGGNLTLANPITVSGTGRLLSNAGTLTIAAGVTQTLTGNYSQSGTYALGVNSPISYGILNVSGNTSFSGGYGFTLLPSSTLVANNLYQGILRSGAISGFSNQTYTQTLGGTSYRYSILQNATNAGWLDLCYGNCFPASTADTQQSIVNTASALQPIYTLQNTVLTNSFSYDCALFGANGVCVSAGGRNTALQAANGLNNTSGLLIASYRVDKNNSRIGAYADQNLSVKNAGSTVTLGNSTPLVGLFGVWSQHPDGIGAEVKVSAAYGQKNTTITRQVVGDSEPGSGSSTLNSQGAQLTAKYGFGVTENTMVSPYLGMRYTQNNMGGYTEGASSTVTAPLTYSALNTNATTALAGLGARHLLNAKTILFASAGVESDTNTSNGTYYATGITGLTPVNFNANPVKTRPTASIGATYLVEKNQQIGLSGIYRQEPYQGVSTTSVFLTYTIGL